MPCKGRLWVSTYPFSLSCVLHAPDAESGGVKDVMSILVNDCKLVLGTGISKMLCSGMLGSTQCGTEQLSCGDQQQDGPACSMVF